MIDLHTHSLLSDGELLPDELLRRCEAQGYRFLAITDHVGVGNCREVVTQLVQICAAYAGVSRVKVFPGAEVTHVHPELIPRVVAEARDAGARVVLGHGETIVEPVAPGTNAAFIRAGVDVLAHPGLISREDAAAAAREGVRLEISARKGHSLTNGHVAAVAQAVGASLCFGSDGHAPGDYPTRAGAEKVLRGAGLTADVIHGIFSAAEAFLSGLG